MTGRDLIIYILQNNLENKDIFAEGSVMTDVLGLVSIERAAVLFNVGFETVNAMIAMGMLNSVIINGKQYVFCKTNLERSTT